MAISITPDIPDPTDPSFGQRVKEALNLIFGHYNLANKAITHQDAVDLGLIKFVNGAYKRTDDNGDAI